MLKFIKQSMQQIENSQDEKDFAQIGDIFTKYLKLCIKKQNVEYLIKNEDRNKVKFSNFEKEYENELGTKIDGIQSFSTQLKELKRKLSVY